MSEPVKTLIPTEGLYVLHLFYRINRAAWAAVSQDARPEAISRLEALIEGAKATAQTQVRTFSMNAKADFGVMIVAPELQALNALEKKLNASLGAGVLEPVYTFFSLTEKSEYTPTIEQFKVDLEQKEKLAPGSPDYEKRVAGFLERIKYSTVDRLNPTLADWPFFCFYPMNKRRNVGQNWYGLPFEDRARLINGHGIIGRKYAGRVTQVVSGSVGLDDWEWGVSLWAHNPYDVKAIVYEMRFDGATKDFGEFGPFYTGVALGGNELWERLGLK